MVAIAPTSPAADAFLAALADPACGPVAAQAAALVVAHPDDESIGCGAQLPRLSGLTVIHVTDGAPRDGRDAARRGFPDPAAYAAVRARELDAALTLAGIAPERRIALGHPDQGVAEIIAPLARQLAALFAARGITVALTHAYEGGHPDHDAVALGLRGAGEPPARITRCQRARQQARAAAAGGAARRVWRVWRVAERAAPGELVVLRCERCSRERREHVEP